MTALLAGFCMLVGSVSGAALGYLASGDFGIAVLAAGAGYLFGIAAAIWFSLGLR